jgi:hypothetical protein
MERGFSKTLGAQDGGKEAPQPPPDLTGDPCTSSMGESNVSLTRKKIKMGLFRGEKNYMGFSESRQFQTIFKEY